MNNIINSLFSRIFCNKNKNIVLSVVALVLTCSLLFSATYAWVESISAVVIDNKISDSETNELKIENRLNTRGTINTDSSATINLAKYIRAAGNVHMSAASSADGVNIFFPVLNDSSAYRKANINDKNVNYYDFSLRIKLNGGSSSNYKDFVFAKDPVINFGSTSGVNDNIRCAIKLDSGATKVYSNVSKTGNVVSGTSSTTKSAESTNTFASGKTASIFKISDSNYHTLNIKLWYQNGSGAANDLAKALTIKDFVIKTDTPSFTVTAKAAYYNSGTSYVEGTAGGTVSPATQSVELNKKGKISATANTSNGYRFVGWFESLTGGSAVGTTATNWETPAITGEKTYYARFIKTYSLTVTVQHSTNNGTTYSTDTTGNSGTVSPASATVDYKGTKTLTATPGTGYEFVGWYNSSFGKLSENNPYTTAAITGNTTIYARFKKYSEVTIYYYNNNSWSKPYAYCWGEGGDQNTAWPGQAMTYEGGKVWSYTYDPSNNWAQHVIFNQGNSTNQTADLDLPTPDSSQRYYKNGSSWLNVSNITKSVTVNSNTNASSVKASYKDKNNTTQNITGQGTASVFDGTSLTLSATAKTGYTVNNFTVTPTSGDAATINNNSSYDVNGNDLTISANISKSSKTISIYVISYIYNSGNVSSSYKLRCVGGDKAGQDVSCVSTGSTTTYKPANTWSTNQTFYKVTAEIPTNTTEMKFHIGNTWYGANGSASSYNTIYIYNYSGDKADYKNE